MLGEPGNSGQELDAVISGAQVGLAAESVAAAERAMEQAVDYAKIRVQFDQPIGSFQAVKHLCARMYEEVESGRSMMYWAAWAQDYASPEEARIAALSAKVYCSRLFRNVASDSVQVLGGAGFSWEHDIHLFLKRAKANEAMLGDHTFNLESVSAMLTTGFLGV
jgi:alkylation response protein AidB-like acyl-CoA dehydrogenase